MVFYYHIASEKAGIYPRLQLRKRKEGGGAESITPPTSVTAVVIATIVVPIKSKAHSRSSRPFIELS